MMNWILVVLFVGIIFKEFKIVNQLVIKTEKKLIETIFLIIGIGVFFYITYIYAKNQMHYLLGILGTILYVGAYLKNGITSKGVVSSYRYLQFVPWDKIEKVHINKGKSIKVSYSGNGGTNRLYFKNKDYDKIIELLNEKLIKNLVIIDHDFSN
ncbi:MULTISPECIES: DUF5673 domain-containing protein [Clostridium]|uniref:DUF5673 domain-containing protein n=1 Tax=Clostridium sporogenes TaxID=1509 RepID=A0A7X5SYL3_CLOSG|nr:MULTISPECIES: DUF5673 domain-containing protein [Clostridium]AJD30630.1 hypothetical protein T258_3519 [Clostridium botulinum Prevot_594]KRU41430.1 hypothetical protein VT94_18950 [Clostridium sporogenes]MBE6056590.1 hypothetical protein [Clostridium sp.]MBY7013972.1 hypothetical protein [Clostridium sporogenes]MBY7063160.1 hypothetical protein [Clostridium sporogenes]